MICFYSTCYVNKELFLEKELVVLSNKLYYSCSDKSFFNFFKNNNFITAQYINILLYKNVVIYIRFLVTMSIVK